MSISKKMGESNVFLSLTNLKIKKNQSIIIFLRYLKFLNKKYFYTKNVNKIFKSFYLNYQRNCYKNWNI